VVSALAKAATPKEPGYTPSTPAHCAPFYDFENTNSNKTNAIEMNATLK
jgi:hypothetical protein